jgi:hypothetical protein
MEEEKSSERGWSEGRDNGAGYSGHGYSRLAQGSQKEVLTEPMDLFRAIEVNESIVQYMMNLRAKGERKAGEPVNDPAKAASHHIAYLK